MPEDKPPSPTTQPQSTPPSPVPASPPDKVIPSQPTPTPDPYALGKSVSPGDLEK